MKPQTIDQSIKSQGGFSHLKQKCEIIKDIEQCRTIREGLQKHNVASSVYNRWKGQLKVGINASLKEYKTH